MATVANGTTLATLAPVHKVALGIAVGAVDADP